MRETNCHACGVIVRGDKLRCPLCGNAFQDANKLLDLDHPKDVFPHIEASFKSHLAIRILVFISIVTVLLSFAVTRFFESEINWPFLILLGIASMWIIVSNVLLKRRSIAKTIAWQVTLLSLLALLWDWAIGWQAWSIEYAIPIICAAATAAMFVIAQVRHMDAKDYVVYLALTALFGLIPFLFIVLDWAEFILPSLICVLVNATMLAAILVFQWESIMSELNKRLHI